MGKEKNPVRNFFYYEKTNDKFTCKIDDCKQVLCGRNNHVSNLERHIQRFHKKEYADLQNKKTAICINVKKRKCVEVEDEMPERETLAKFLNIKRLKQIEIDLDEQRLKDACVELVTKNGRPFSLIEDSGFQKIINPLMQAFKAKGRINSENTKIKIYTLADEFRQKIKKETKNKMISVKMDAATRLNRSILGINIQFIQNSIICLRTIAMKDLDESHTGIYLKNILLGILKEYEINVNQIYSVTTDNGANMIKCVELLSENEDLEIETTADDDNIDNDAIIDSDEIIENEESNLFENNDLGEFIVTSNSNNIILKSVRCAAHTLQLAVHDVLKLKIVCNMLAKCRFLVKRLRTPKITCIIKKTPNMRTPIIDCPTRWNSTFDMVVRLQEFKLFCFELENTFKFLKTSPELWEFMDNFVAVFQPIKNATLKLQEEHLLLGDFYSLWTMTKLKVNLMQHILAKKLSEAMNKREKILLDNNFVNAALYLDPRFQFLLSSSNIKAAQSHLMHTWKTLKIIKEINQVEIETGDQYESECESSQSTEMANDLEIFLASEAEKLRKIPIYSSSEIENIIKNFLNVPRIKSDTNILEYWETKKQEESILYELAQVVLAVPATQASVERNFSVLKYVFSHLRCRLSEETLQDILLIKLNNNFIE